MPATARDAPDSSAILGWLAETPAFKRAARDRAATIAAEGIVKLDGRGMLVVSVARQLGSEGSLLAYCAARSNQAGPQKGAPGPLS